MALTKSKNDFEIFKSSVCHSLHSLGDVNFIHRIIETKTIEQYFLSDRYAESLYLLAMVDYLCRINGMRRFDQYEQLRQLRLETPLFPKSMLLLEEFTDDTGIIQDMLDRAIPEFSRFNIIEGDIRNVI